MEVLRQQYDVEVYSFWQAIQKRSDLLMDFFLPGYFLIGVVLAFFYDTWFIALLSGGICLLAHYSVKIILPESDLYQYVLSAVFGVFMAQYIYQMHGLFEMHFFAFIGSAVLITYQKWKLQIPILIVVFIHHLAFSYLQNIGITNVFFTQLNFFDLQTFIIHILLTVAIVLISGLWAYQLKKYNQIYLDQSLQMARLQREVDLSEERKKNAELLSNINETLNQKAKELEFSNAELERFAYAASHDLQEPLRTITAFLNQLDIKYSYQLDTKGKKYIDFAVDGALRMRQIINDLLDFSRIGRLDEKREVVNLREIVSEITVLYQKQIEESGAIITYGFLPALSTFKAPLKQIFLNLIGNGLKYQEPGQIPEINITCVEEKKEWKFLVSDNGIGINKEDFDKIFIIFRRLHGGESYPGTGMGLAITKKIVGNLGGKIWVDSVFGKGTTFNFTIPKSEIFANKKLQLN